MPPIIATLPHLIAKHYKSIAFALVVLFAVYQRHQATKWHDRAIACQNASRAAADATKALRETERKEYQEKADHAEQEHKQALNDVRTATSRYIAANRVQPPRHISAPAAVDQAGDTAEPSPVPSGVVVDQADVQACGDLYAYAVNAHDYLMSIGN